MGKNITGERIRELRLKNKWSQQALGIMLKKFNKNKPLSQGMIGHFENGQRFPNFKMLLGLSEVFNVEISYLLGETEYYNKKHDMDWMYNILKQYGYLKKYGELNKEKIIKTLDIINQIKTID